MAQESCGGLKHHELVGSPVNDSAFRNLLREGPMPFRISSRAVSIFLSALVCSCLVGLVAYGTDILDPRMTAFQFVASGAIAGALAAAVAGEHRKAVWVVGGLSLLSFVAITRPDTAAFLFRDLMYVPTLVASVWLSWGAASRVPHSGLSRVLAWVVVFSLCHLAAFVILTVANGSAFDLQVAYAATRVGGLVGLGVGLGVYFASRPWLQVDKVLENQGR